MSKLFAIEISYRHELPASAIWPDGDAPAEPTAEDVMAVIRQSLGSGRMPRLQLEWSLDDRATVTITGSDGDETTADIGPPLRREDRTVRR